MPLSKRTIPKSVSKKAQGHKGAKIESKTLMKFLLKHVVIPPPGITRILPESKRLPAQSCFLCFGGSKWN